MNFHSYVIPLLAALLLAGGCSEKETGPKRVQATGTVNYKGQPVEGAMVILSPETPGVPAATAQTDASGQFKLGTKEAGDGAVPGRYKVTIAKTETPLQEEIKEDDPRYGNPLPEVQSKELLPVKYKDPAKSGLSVEIRDGEENILPPFELTD